MQKFSKVLSTEKPATAHQKYRPEIDGLRAVAVLPVILFHAGFHTFGGGYVGVDVFFVISGFLITTIIVAEKEAETFSLARFYERRARRILPALFLVMLVCLPFALLWLLPSDLENFAKSLIAVSTFWSNILFGRQTGYFDTVAPLKPLVHTWSLAVEEQFYVLFPLLILLAWRLGKIGIPAILIGVSVISLLAAQWGSIYEPGRSFFLLQNRAWELAIGALIAIYMLRTNGGWVSTRFVSESLSIAGLLAIFVAVFVFDSTTPYPSFYTLLPTLGAALIILFATPGTIVGRSLGSRTLVAIGLISYSAYLWHQPLFAFARYRFIGQPHWSLFLWLTLLTFLLAFLSWRFIELPFRNRGRVKRNQILKVGVAGTSCFLLIGLAIYLSAGFPGRMPGNVAWRSFGEKRRAVGMVCEPNGTEVAYCSFGDLSSSTVVGLYGDSHAAALQYALDKEFKDRHIKGLLVGAAGCHVIPQVFDVENTRLAAKCAQSYAELLNFVREKVDAVIIAARWTYRLYPIKGRIEELAFDNQEGGLEHTRYREFVALDSSGAFVNTEVAKRRSVRHFLDSMGRTGKKIILIYPIPELGWDIAKLNFFLGPLESLTTSYQLYQSRNRFILQVFDAYEAPNLTKIKAGEIFCSKGTGRCAAQVSFLPLYYDDSHLSEAGAELVVKRVMKALP